MKNIKCGSCCNGIVLTDMPIEQLIAMRDSINAIISDAKDDYVVKIQSAIDEARDAGFEVYINGYPCESDEVDIMIYAEGEDEE